MKLGKTELKQVNIISFVTKTEKDSLSSITVISPLYSEQQGLETHAIKYNYSF